jgi:hypothetical protein
VANLQPISIIAILLETLPTFSVGYYQTTRDRKPRWISRVQSIALWSPVHPTRNSFGDLRSLTTKSMESIGKKLDFGDA